MAEKITSVTLRQKVYEQLRAKILGAELLPGEIINLRGLADRFGVSLLPVREAVWQLESEKILVVESNKKIPSTELISEFSSVTRANRLAATADALALNSRSSSLKMRRASSSSKKMSSE